MTLIIKNVDDLMPADFSKFPVWEFALELETVDDMLVRPVTTLPVHDMANRFLGTRVRLANGTELWAKMGNLDLNSAVETRKFLGMSPFWNGEWIHLARPIDGDRQKRGPTALARTLGLRLDEVFPISYDVSDCCVGDPDVVRGMIEA